MKPVESEKNVPSKNTDQTISQPHSQAESAIVIGVVSSKELKTDPMPYA